MANEFKHKDPGSELTQAEYIASSGDGHIFACQATGDILYASSATVLKNLGKGNANEVLNMGGSCIPAWTASPSVTDLTIGGGCITLSAATDIDLTDNVASALSFDATGKTGIIDIVTTDCSEGVTMSGTLGVTGALTATAGITVGSAGSGADVTFHSATSGDNFLWDSSCEKLVITGTNGQVALCVADGNVLVVDTLYFYDAGGEYISSNGSVLAITGATTISSTLGVTGAVTANAGVVVDNFTLDGTELDLSSGNFTLDVAGDVEINADGGCINFKDATLALAAIVNTSCVGELRIHEAANYVGFKAPALSGDQIWTLPAAVACCACDVLTCNGSGVLSWAAAGGAVSAVANGSDNRIATFSSSTALNGEAALTFSSGVLANATANSGGTNQITLSNTAAAVNSHAFLDMENGASGGNQGNVGIFIHGESSNFYYIGMQASNPVMSIGAHGSKSLGSNDIMRFSDAAPPDITYNTAHPEGTFDYVCDSCGKHSHEKFLCCGTVEWHDDILAIRDAAIAVNTMANPYEPGQNVSIDQMVRLGVMEYDTPIKPGHPERGAWLGLNPVTSTWLTWAGMYQNRERMDAYYADHEEQIRRLAARLEEVESNAYPSL